MNATNIVNISGGKDSGACLELALMRGRPFRAVIADTGNESPVTWDHVARLDERVRESGLAPGVEVFRADFTDRIARKRHVVETKWRAEGIPEEWIGRALAVLQPTGNPFLDLCIWKGRFPSIRAQFCTDHLKTEVIFDRVIEPALGAGPVVQWLGVRREESRARAQAPMFQTVRTPGASAMLLYRPLIHWSAQNVIEFARWRGAPINPLYRMGMNRVGCFPCIHAGKGELAQIAKRFPEAFERIAEWEAVVAEASKRGAATFFASDTTPEGRRMAKDGVTGARDGERYPGAREVATWAQTARGGRQFDWVQQAELDEGLACSSSYGLCE